MRLQQLFCWLVSRHRGHIAEVRYETKPSPNGIGFWYWQSCQCMRCGAMTAEGELTCFDLPEAA